jgi:hypothetical protein
VFLVCLVCLEMKVRQERSKMFEVRPSLKFEVRSSPNVRSSPKFEVRQERIWRIENRAKK